MKTALFFLACLFVASSTKSYAALYLTLDELERSTTFASDQRFASVGAITWEHPSNPFQIAGSGVLIAPNWVLTAAHVVDAFNRNTTGPVNFGLGLNASDPFAIARVAESIRHPTWSGILSRGDIALLRLETPIDMQYASLYRGREPSSSWTPTAYMAGYGQYGILNGDLQRDQFLRAGANVVYRGPSSTNDTWTVDLAGLRPNDRIDMEWKGTPGDSGGGWFIDVDGEWQLGAITSSSFLPYNGPYTTSATSVSRFATWIGSNVTAIPEPNAFFLCCAGVMFFATRCRRWSEQSVAPGG